MQKHSLSFGHSSLLYKILKVTLLCFVLMLEALKLPIIFIYEGLRRLKKT